MDIFPTELHSYICQLACTDDGRTARSLAQLSKYFRDVSEPFRYQSIAISGIDQILELVSRLQNGPPHIRPIRHLFISDKSYPRDDHQPRKDAHDLAGANMSHILRLAAPTLESLTFCASCPANSTALIAALFNLAFPRLFELTVVGFYPFPRLPAGMPRLERLHLSGNRNPHGLLQIGNLGAACPNLTHLRISGLCMALSFVEELEEALTEKRDPHALFESKLPSKVRCLLVQPGPAPLFAGKHRVWDKMENAMMKKLVQLSEDVKGVNYFLVDRNLPESSCELVRREWAERLDGGNGCWIGHAR